MLCPRLTEPEEFLVFKIVGHTNFLQKNKRKNCMSKNGSLGKARDAKEDEFYTQLNDISNELKYYKEHFKGKTVLCNCDDPRVSNFFHYFSYNFETLGLKKLITTCYKNQERDLFSQNNSEKAISLEYCGEKNGSKVPTVEEIGIKELQGYGDFLASIFSKDKAVVEAAHSYLKAYSIDTLFVSFLFCFIGYFNGFVKTGFVMAQGIIGAFYVLIPVSYAMSRSSAPSLFRIGLATPCSTLLQIVLCVSMFIISLHDSHKVLHDKAYRRDADPAAGTDK